MVKEKYVRIFCDYCADPFWHKHGGMMGYEQLPISDTLKMAFYAWDQHFQFNDTYLAYWSDKYGEKGFLSYFSKMGEMLAKQVKKELPDWTVVYLNKQLQHEYNKELDELPDDEQPKIIDRSSWEYEVQSQENNLEYQFKKG